MKRKLWIILALAALMAALGCGAALADDDGSCGTNVTYSFDSATGTLTISGTGAMADYDMSSNLSPFARNTEIQTVYVNEGVTSIGYAAFYGCSGITEVSLPESVSVIGGQAFRSCSGLGHITLPNGLDSIGTGAFSFCRGLTSVTLPDSLTAIDTGVFINCSGLTSVSIPGNVVNVGSSAFTFCSSLTSVTFHNPDTVIGADAFTSANASLTIYGWLGSTAQTYAQAAGIGFESLGSIAGTCGDNVTWTFDPATGAMTISGSGRMASFNSGNDAPWYNYRERITSVSIGSGVTNIGAYAFMDCTDLSGVTIPDSVNSIGGFAFCNCTALKSVTIPRSITGIYTHAFSNCGSLISVTIPGSVNNIESYAFDNCKALAGVTIMKPTTLITASAFTNCPDLTIHGWVDSTAETYANNNSIPFESLGSPSGSCGNNGDNVTYSFNPATGALTISGTGAMENYEVVDPDWWNYRSLVTAVVIENGVTSIGDYAFFKCTGLTSVTIPNGVTSIGIAAFYGCTGLTSVTIPDSVTSIGYAAFCACTGLTDVTILNPNCAIGDEDLDVFTGCSASLVLHGYAGTTAQTYAQATGISFEAITIPAPTFTLPAALTTIESEAFSGIAAEAVLIPAGVTDISGDPFAGSGVRFIYGAPSSAAETLANTYGYIFVPVTD